MSLHTTSLIIVPLPSDIHAEKTILAADVQSKVFEWPGTVTGKMASGLDLVKRFLHGDRRYAHSRRLAPAAQCKIGMNTIILLVSR